MCFCAGAVFNGAVEQTYVYSYKNNAAHDLDSLTVSGYVFKPKTDVYGRNTGKEILNGSSKIAGEYITYRKVGDHATNMPSTVFYASGSAVKDNLKYKYDNCGNISEILENGELKARYAYDGLNRLVREDNKKCYKTFLYDYDHNGNVLCKKETDFTLKTNIEEEEFEVSTYAYEGDRLTSYNGYSFEYNNLGSPTTYMGKTVAWKYGRLLETFDGINFTYDGAGRRVSKGNITYSYDSNGRLIKSSDGLEFIYDNSGVAGVKYNGVQYFYRKDALGNIIAILDTAGKAVVHYEYDAWGNQAVIDENNDPVTEGIGVLNPFRYRGYYYDTETGLYYLKSRYYDPEIGRFISQDSIEYADPETINGLNLYAYCLNNPIMNIDTNGTFVSTVIGALIGGIWGGINAMLKGQDVLAGVAVGAATGALAGFFVDAAIATAGTSVVGAIAIATVGGFAVGFAGDLATQALVEKREEIDWSSATLSGGITAITNLFGLGISFAAAGLGTAPMGSFLQKLIGSLKPSATPLGSWIGQFILGFGLARLPSLPGYVKKR